MSEEKDKAADAAVPDKEPLLLTEEVTPAKASPGAKSSAQPSKKTPDKSAPKSSSKGFWFASLLALLAMSVAVASAYRMEMQRTDYQKDLLQKQQMLNMQSSQIEALNTKLNELSQVIAADQSAANGLTAQLDSLGQLVSANQQRLDTLAGSERSDWQLAEVEYLLRLANQRLTMSGEVRGAKALLVSADEILLELDDIHFMSVREAIAKDIAALNRADRFDLEGLYLRIASLSENIDYMELRSDKRWQEEPLPQNDEVKTESWWQTHLETTLSALSNLVVIRSSDQRVLPQMNDVELMQLQQGMHFLLEQAKYAVISGKQNLYDASLASMQRWVTSYYDLEKPISAATLREVEALQGIDIAQQWPDISTSLDKLKMLMKARLGLPQKQRATATKPAATSVVEPSDAAESQGEQQ